MPIYVEADGKRHERFITHEGQIIRSSLDNDDCANRLTIKYGEHNQMKTPADNRRCFLLKCIQPN